MGLVPEELVGVADAAVEVCPKLALSLEGVSVGE
jgi:ferredoxin